MIQLINQKEVNTEKWDACIRKDSGRLFYGLSWYLDILGAEWDALVLNDYEAVMPLFHNKKWGVNYLYRPYGVQQLGIFSTRNITEDLVAEFISSIPKKYSYIDIFLNHHNPVSKLKKSSLKENINLELNLKRSYREIYEGYSTRTKRNLDKAKKAKHRVFEFDSPDQLIKLFQENRGTRINTLSEANYLTMRQIMYVILHKKRGYLWTIYDAHNTICAGAFFVEIGGRIVLLFSATNDVGRKNQAMTYLLDELFIAKATDDIIFDFEGSNIKGLFEFYRSFGAVEKNYFNLKINRMPLPFRWLKK